MRNEKRKKAQAARESLIATDPHASIGRRFRLSASFRIAGASVVVFSLLSAGLSSLSALFSFQIYDRVLTSHSEATLVVLCLLFLIIYASSGWLQTIALRLNEAIASELQKRHEADFVVSSYLDISDPDPTQTERLVTFQDVIAGIRSGSLSTLADLIWLPFLAVMIYLLAPLVLIFVLLVSALILLAGYVANADEQSAPQDLFTYSDALRSRSFRSSIPLERLAQQIVDVKVRLARENSVGFRRLALSVTSALRSVLQMGVLSIGAWLAIRQEISIGVIMALSVLSMKFIQPLQSLGRRNSSVVSFLKAYLSLLAPHEPKGLMQLPSDPVSLSIMRMKLPPLGTDQTPRFISFSLQAGHCILLSGDSGSGKSLILRRLLREAPVQPNVARICGLDVREINQSALGEAIGYLPQTEAVIQSGTLLQMISRFDPQATIEKVQAACVAVNVETHVATLEGTYHAPMRAVWNKLPFGVRRRLLLARAVYGSPKILVLDDPFQGLSSSGVDAILNLIKAAKQNNCAVLISDPLLIASKLADQIIFIDKNEMRAQSARRAAPLNAEV